MLQQCQQSSWNELNELKKKKMEAKIDKNITVNKMQ